MLQPKLYLCPTPIGNMEDMTLRALRVLRECHRIYCEDTRNTGAMLSRLGISKPLISCHEHNEEGRAEEIAGRVAEGEAIAFVSDAGLPGISDPGERLVAAGVRGIWNFTNYEISLNSREVVVESVHFSDSLLALSYMISQREDTTKEETK